MTRRPYPSDLDDDTLFFIIPYLLLSPENAGQRKYSIREVLNALFYVTRTGVQWRYLPHDFPPPEVVRQQAQRWHEAGCFEMILHECVCYLELNTDELHNLLR